MASFNPNQDQTSRVLHGEELNQDLNQKLQDAANRMRNNAQGGETAVTDAFGELTLASCCINNSSTSFPNSLQLTTTHADDDEVPPQHPNNTVAQIPRPLSVQSMRANGDPAPRGRRGRGRKRGNKANKGALPVMKTDKLDPLAPSWEDRRFGSSALLPGSEALSPIRHSGPIPAAPVLAPGYPRTLLLLPYIPKSLLIYPQCPPDPRFPSCHTHSTQTSQTRPAATNSNGSPGLSSSSSRIVCASAMRISVFTCGQSTTRR